MANKRKNSASYDHARTKSKKSNIGTENTRGTSSAHCTDNQKASMSAVDLNMVNLQEQVSGLPSGRFDNYAVACHDVIDLTLTTSSSESDEPYVISSGTEQDNGNNYNSNRSRDDKTTEDSSSTLTGCSSVSDNNLDDLLRTSDNIDTHKHPNSVRYIDDESNTTYSECSTAVTSRVSQQNHDHYQTKNDEEMNNSRSKFTNYSYKTNGFGCSCVDLNKHCSDDGVRTTNNIRATKHSNTFQCGDDEINAITTEWSTAITSVGLQGNGFNNYNQTQYYEGMNDTRSKSITETPRGSTVITSIREQENGCFVHLTEYDEAMNEIRSATYAIEQPTTPSSEKPISSFVVMSLGQNLNEYNGEGTTQTSSSISSEHEKDPSVAVYSLMRDLVHPNVSSGDD